jgi:hypothetical protein
MQLKQRHGALARSASESAFGGDAEPGLRARGGPGTSVRALDAVFVVDEPQIQLGVVGNLESGQGGEVGVVVTVDRNRQMEPVDPARRGGEYGTGERGELPASRGCTK